jgi:hypothetical protein
MFFIFFNSNAFAVVVPTQNKFLILLFVKSFQLQMD